MKKTLRSLSPGDHDEGLDQRHAKARIPLAPPARAPILYGSGPQTVTSGEGSWTSLVERLIGFILPRLCLACALHPAGSALGLCSICFSRLRAQDWGRCRACGKGVAAFAGRRDLACGRCRRRPPPIERLLFLYPYTSPFDAVIHGLKYQRLEYLASVLATEMLDRFAELLAPYDLLTPIPLHRWRRLKRGFNQAQALAEPLADALGKECSSLLEHQRGRPQSVLGLEERAANARRLLRISPQMRLDGKRVLVIDDVTTTGATLHTAARLLLGAGARSVAALVAARTPTPGSA